LTTIKERSANSRKSNGSNDILRRKIDHLKISIEEDVQYNENFFDEMRLLHYSAPEINFKEIDLSTNFFKKVVSAPICITAITGGPGISKEINMTLAKAAEEEQIIMSVGSQRAGLIKNEAFESFSIVRDVAPNIPVIGNIGVGQISDPDFSLNDFEECINMIRADAMAIHFNALHELVQDKGDISYKMFSQNFHQIRERFKIPIIAKEVGTGFSYDYATVIDKLGFDGFDIGGTGGTNFTAIEEKRQNGNTEDYTRNLTEIFREWGIPTPVSIVYTRENSNKLIIATGGLRNGIDIAKAIALGADIGGFAHKFLLTAWEDLKDHGITRTIKEIKTLKNELRSALWLLNMKNPKELKLNKEKYVLLGKLYQWLNQ
jgi:isopentenyl-diphosphate delta-isomerase